MKKYPTPWQHKMMWASLSAFFVVVLFLIVGTVVYLSANLIAFLQPILIPVAIAAILAVLVSGWGEVNLGDSEVLGMILAVIACGYTAVQVDR